MDDRFEQLDSIVDGLRNRHALDPRISVFEIECELVGEALRLGGASTDHMAADELARAVAALDAWERVDDHVLRLPDARNGGPSHGIVASALVPLLAGPVVTETHVSQEVLGRPLSILQRAGRWYRCRTGDGYIGWVHRGYFVPADENSLRAWDAGSGGESCISLGAEVLAPDGTTQARLPWGARFVLEDGHVVRLPDERRGMLAGNAVKTADLERRFPSAPAAIVTTATRWTGAPYLWGGVTPAGVDCSGLVQAVYRLHGIELPRDSDLQADVGDPIAVQDDFANIRAGDLLFFAEHGDLISHVAISAGGAEIVHASLGNGGVARNDLLGEHPYERELRSLLVSARRYL